MIVRRVRERKVVSGQTARRPKQNRTETGVQRPNCYPTNRVQMKKRASRTDQGHVSLVCAKN